MEGQARREIGMFAVAMVERDRAGWIDMPAGSTGSRVNAPVPGAVLVPSPGRAGSLGLELRIVHIVGVLLARALGFGPLEWRRCGRGAAMGDEE